MNPLELQELGATDCTFVPPTGNTEGKIFFSKGKHHRVERKISSPICEAIIEH